MTHGTDPKSPNFFTKLGVLLGVIIEVATGIFSKMTEAQLQHWIGRKKSFRKDLQKELQKMFNITDMFVEEKEVWRKFYQKHFAFDLNFADVIVPDKPVEGTWRLIVVAQGLTLNQTYDAMSKAFKVWRYTENLDAAVTKNARTTTTAYAVWVRDGVEPDEKYLGKSTNQADPNMILGVTLLERMLHEIIFFEETGNHLDIKGGTFCSGSRNSDGSVPLMSWYSDDREVQVYWFSLDNSDAWSGVREAVS